MSQFLRLRRITRSLTGGLFKGATHVEPDCLMIFNDLGLQLKPDTLKILTRSAVFREELRMQLELTEKELGKSVLETPERIHPNLNPKVYEEGQQVAISITIQGEEFLLARFDLSQAG